MTVTSNNGMKREGMRKQHDLTDDVCFVSVFNPSHKVSNRPGPDGRCYILILLILGFDAPPKKNDKPAEAGLCWVTAGG